MLLTIYNLPADCRYSDVKSLLEKKCGLTELILDQLVSEGKTKKVTVGVADEGDAAILVQKINGLYFNGLQLYVEDKRKKMDLDQPYRSTASMLEAARYQQASLNEPQVMEGAMMTNISNRMLMNYNMMGMYMPMMPMTTMDQSITYMAYGVPQAMPSAEFLPVAPVPNERGFQAEGNLQGRREGPQDRPWDGPPGRGRDEPPGRGRDGTLDRRRDGPQGRAIFQNRDRNRRPSPERPETFNRPRRVKELEPRFPRREKSPRQSRGTPEMNQEPGPHDPKQFQPRQPEPEFRRTDSPWERRCPSRWNSKPEPHVRPQPDQELPNTGPVQNFDPEPDRPWDRSSQTFEEPNPHWDRRPNRSDEGYRPPGRFEPNQLRFDDNYPQNNFRGEPEFWRRELDFHRREPNIQTLDRHEPRYNNDRERRPRQPDAGNKGNDSRDRNPGARREDRPIQHGRPERPPKPSTSNYQGNERREDRPPNPKRPNYDCARGPDKWNEIANDYSAPKKPRGILPEPRHRPPIPPPIIDMGEAVKGKRKPGTLTSQTHAEQPHSSTALSTQATSNVAASRVEEKSSNRKPATEAVATHTTTPLTTNAQFEAGWTLMGYSRRKGQTGKLAPKKAAPGLSAAELKVKRNLKSRLKRKRKKAAFRAALTTADGGPIPGTSNVANTGTGKKANPRAKAKRARLVDTTSPGDTKKQRLHSVRPYPNFAEAKADLQVAITTEAGHLSPQQAKELEGSMEELLMRDTLLMLQAADSTGGPPPSPLRFRGKPVHADGALKFWCEDQKALDWLDNSVASLTLSTGENLVLRKQSELSRRVRCGILLPGIRTDMGVVVRVLQAQNPWADVTRWLIVSMEQQLHKTWVVFSIPEDLVAPLMQNQRRLSFMIGSVYAKFQGPKGRFLEEPPTLPGTGQSDTAEAIETEAVNDAVPSTSRDPANSQGNPDAGDVGNPPKPPADGEVCEWGVHGLLSLGSIDDKWTHWLGQDSNTALEAKINFALSLHK